MNNQDLVEYFFSDKYKQLLVRKGWSKVENLHLTTKGEFTTAFSQLMVSNWSKYKVKEDYAAELKNIES